MIECNCIDEETESCAYNEHNKCDETTIPHMCMCSCHINMIGDRFAAHGLLWIKTGLHTVERV